MNDTLKTIFCRGLSPELQSELACRDEGRDLDQFIELTIHIDNLIRARKPTQRTTFHASPVLTVEETEPMQMNNFHLSPEEWNRQLNHRLCLYCGQPGHPCLSCPSRPSLERKKVVSLSLDALNSEMCITVPITLTVNEQCITTTALLDSGAAGNFMSRGFVSNHNIALIECSSPLTVEAIDGRPLGTGLVTGTTQELIMQTGLLHSETIQFYILPTPSASVILRLPWLRRHDPHISWREGQISCWSENCFVTCLSTDLSMPLRNISMTDSMPDSNIPEEYRDLSEAFSKSRATNLLPHRSYNWAIDLIPGSSPPKGRIFPLSQPESETLKAYIEEELANGFIRPSTSPASAGFFFVHKKDGGLRPCIDYRGFNKISLST